MLCKRCHEVTAFQMLFITELWTLSQSVDAGKPLHVATAATKNLRFTICGMV